MSEYISSDVLATEAKKLYEELKTKIDDNSLTPKERGAIPQQEMPTGEPMERARSMGEVATGYTVEQAIVEANRCLQCKNAPCVNGCPVSVPIPSFIAEVAKGEFKKAVDIIKTCYLWSRMSTRKTMSRTMYSWKNVQKCRKSCFNWSS